MKLIIDIPKEEIKLYQAYGQINSHRIMSYIADGKPLTSLGEEMRITQKAITDEKVLIGFNMAVALCNKHFGKNTGMSIDAEDDKERDYVTEFRNHSEMILYAQKSEDKECHIV